jgi:hypothetical protein
MVPSIWGSIPKGEDPYVIQTSGGKLNPSVCLHIPRNMLIRMRFIRLLLRDVKNRQIGQERYDSRDERGRL